LRTLIPNRICVTPKNRETMQSLDWSPACLSPWSDLRSTVS
jgi:hypothetical protein